MPLLLAAHTLPFPVLVLPPVASTECPWAPDWEETRCHSQDRTWMFCNPPSTENSESCFSATLFYAHSCCGNYTLLLFIGLSHTYFYLCNVTNLYSMEAQFSDVPIMMYFHYFELASPFRFASLAGFHFKKVKEHHQCHTSAPAYLNAESHNTWKGFERKGFAEAFTW